MNIRKPAVAGRFYPGNASDLDEQLNTIRKKELPNIDTTMSKKNIIGGIVPHAGYMYSAYQAMHFFEVLKKSQEVFETFFIINPNHTGYGPEIALEENDYWSTPYGNIEIDTDFQNLLDFEKSEEAHKFEHSGEVLLPLLQYSLDYDFKIVPITMYRQTPQNAARLAEAIVGANSQLEKKICVIASSDFSHFVDPEVGLKLDRYVIDQILKFNTQGVFDEVRERQISVCGYGPIMTLMEYASMICDEPAAQVLKVGHSGEIHQSQEVVDYVSMLFYKNHQAC